MTQKVFSLFAFATMLVLSISSCTNKNKQTILGDVCDTSDTKYSTFVSKIVTDHCISCHSDASMQGGLSIEGYAKTSAEAANILSTIKDGSMPKGGTPLDDCTVTKLEKWINAGKPNN